MHDLGFDVRYLGNGAAVLLRVSYAPDPTQMAQLSKASVYHPGLNFIGVAQACIDDPSRLAVDLAQRSGLPSYVQTISTASESFTFCHIITGLSLDIFDTWWRTRIRIFLHVGEYGSPTGTEPAHQ